MKNLLAMKAREIFIEHDVRRYVFAAEAWTSGDFGHPNMSDQEIERRYAALGFTFANAPDREEVIFIEAADGRELLMARREIIRLASGRAYLGKLGEIMRPEHVRGRFLESVAARVEGRVVVRSEHVDRVCRRWRKRYERKRMGVMRKTGRRSKGRPVGERKGQ